MTGMHASGEKPREAEPRVRAIHSSSCSSTVSGTPPFSRITALPLVEEHVAGDLILAAEPGALEPAHLLNELAELRTGVIALLECRWLELVTERHSQDETHPACSAPHLSHTDDPWMALWPDAC